MGKNPSGFKGPQNPVETVSWDEAAEFCRKLSQKAGKTVRLPTEAEWEYACRAGTKTRFGFGEKDEDLHKYGNYCDKSNTSRLPWQDKDHNDGFDKTGPVGSLKPNDWGLYDMHGNVWEWCSDWYADSYANANKTDPTGPVSGTNRVLRGGSWFINPQGCRSASRYRNVPGGRDSFVGFRVAVDLK
jgi:formylglycine-generating enzyme required for sulfatase activity